MDEDTNGYFRIITKHRMPEQATDLYVLDSSLKMHGSLTNIEPKEDFKASRYYSFISKIGRPLVG
jgi:uncharacterized secreted protein with C-terminal beta-propeller domain